MPRGLGNPVHVCTNHVAPLTCQRRCLGVELDGLAELKSMTHDGCAVCQSAANLRPFKTLRRCHHLGCYGRFHPVSVDELNLGEWIAFYRQRLRRAVSLVFRR
jgi:hypothetical protein